MRQTGPRRAGPEPGEREVATQMEREQPARGGDRRAHVRHAIDLPAQLDVDGRDPRPARILDFCVGGLFLRVEGQQDDYLVMAARQIGRGDRLRVSFQTRDGGESQAHAVPVEVARLFDGGMGVAFAPAQPSAIRALQRLSESGRRAAETATATGAVPAVAEAGAILSELRQRIEPWLHWALDESFKSAGESLFVEARDATSNVVQSECMDALKDVERVCSGVRDATVSGVLRAFDRLAPDSRAPLPAAGPGASDAAEEGGLALVDTASFDDWVTVKNIISRHEPRLREEAYALARRLSVVCGRALDEMSNPLGVQQLGTAFNEAMQNLGLQRRARKAIYQGFERQLVERLGELQQTLNARLVERGILPKVERPRPATPRRPAAVPPAGERPAPEQAAAPEQEPSPAAAPAPEPAAHSPGPAPAAPPAGHPGAAPPPAAAGPRTGVPGWAGHGAAAPGGNGGEAAPARDPGAAPGGPAPAAEPGAAPAAASGAGDYRSPLTPAQPQVGMGQAYQAARSLMGLQRAVSQGAGIAHAPPGTAGEVPAGAVSPHLLGALDKVQALPEMRAPEPRQPLRLKERLRAALARDGLELSATESEAVDVLATLIEAVLGDPLIHDAIKPRIQRLSVPLLRTALEDQAFFADEAHPARQVVNRLGMLGLPDRLAEGEEGDSLEASVDPLVEQVVREGGDGPAAFDRILPRLDAIVERQRERFRRNVGAIVETRERQQAMLAERRRGEPPASRRVAPELAPWFQRTERLKVGDVVTFKAGTEEAEPRTLAWVSDDHETFVFADSTGRRTASVAQQELALEMLRGSARVMDATELPAMDRGVYQMLQQIHRALAEERGRDAVTGLMPVHAFEARLEDAIGRAQRRGSKHALLALDLDGFGTINQSCGRKAGDSLLRKLSRLLERQIGEQGCITRAYADEFLILLEDHGFQDARRFAERQCRAISNSRVVFEGEQYPITASIGLVPVTRAGETAEAMIDSARAALAGAKRRGGNQLRVFDPDEDHLPPAADAPVQGAGAAAAGLGELLDAGRLVLERQAVRPLGDAEARPHYEVLLAMRDDDGAVRALPGDLLLEAEHDERTAEVDRWVIRTTLAWMREHRREVVRSGGFAINLAGPTLADPKLLEYVVGQLTESSVPPAKVIFEVTESVAIDRLSSAVDFIRTLREYGCRFSIDDFGAGHATFSYLKTLPVDFVKIDGMFVRDLADNDNDFAMVKSINEISHLLGKHTIAEHVDSEPVLARLEELGVDFAQGSALSEPEPMQ